MPTIQVTLSDQQTQALRALAQRTGKTEGDVIVEAVGQFLAQQALHEQQAARQQVNTLRDENNRYSPSAATELASWSAWRYDVEVLGEGRVELQVPFPQGSHIVVYVTEEPAAESFADLLAASSTSLDFWDNALDDEDWNNV